MAIPPHTTRSRGYLPHWEAAGATYHVTFRLADALPQDVLRGYVREREAIVENARAMKRPLTVLEHRRLEEFFSEKVERALDAGMGACHLRHPDVGRMVFEAVRYFHGSRYWLYTWCVMPNHVHALVSPMAGYGLDGILHSWKSFTAHAAGKILGRVGVFWMAEYFDHMVRDGAGFGRAHRYILDNPGRAGLGDWPWCATLVGVEG